MRFLTVILSVLFSALISNIGFGQPPVTTPPGQSPFSENSEDPKIAASEFGFRHGISMTPSLLRRGIAAFSYVTPLERVGNKIQAPVIGSIGIGRTVSFKEHPELLFRPEESGFTLPWNEYQNLLSNSLIKQNLISADAFFMFNNEPYPNALGIFMQQTFARFPSSLFSNIDIANPQDMFFNSFAFGAQWGYFFKTSHPKNPLFMSIFGSVGRIIYSTNLVSQDYDFVNGGTIYTITNQRTTLQTLEFRIILNIGIGW